MYITSARGQLAWQVEFGGLSTRCHDALMVGTYTSTSAVAIAKNIFSIKSCCTEHIEVELNASMQSI
jgi:hypothetical protein